MRPLPRFMPALITPFSRSGALDLGAHEENVAHLWDLGSRGYLVGGSTGEGPYLEPGERRLLVEATRSAAPRAHILCGIHAETVRVATAASAEATDAGADALLLTTPTTLVRHRPDLITEFFIDVVEAADVPVLLYSVPKVTGVELGEASVSLLAAHDGVIGMKDSGGDPLRAGRIAAATPGDFALFTGSTPAITLAIAAGAFGAITASANYALRLVRDTVIAARRSPRTAEVAQARLSKASGAIEQFGVAAVKYAASRVGLKAGSARAPLRPLPPSQRTAVRRALRLAGLG